MNPSIVLSSPADSELQILASGDNSVSRTQDPIETSKNKGLGLDITDTITGHQIFHDQYEPILDILSDVDQICISETKMHFELVVQEVD